jgi:hypothetical protein
MVGEHPAADRETADSAAVAVTATITRETSAARMSRRVERNVRIGNSLHLDGEFTAAQ